jgi:peptidoglycan/xylan/chitin deacetylase (PgdA/CDA1 family)
VTRSPGLAELAALIALILLCGSISQAQGVPSRSIALTFDDLPLAVVGDDRAAGNLAEVQRVNSHILATLAKHHASATGFVNEIKLNVGAERDARAAVLRGWIAAGMELGNHTYSHPALSQAGLSKYEDDFVRGSSITSAEMTAAGKTEKYFRYPYLDTGKDKAEKDAFVAFYDSRGFLNAPVTVQNQDWLYNAPYSEAVARYDEAETKHVVDDYLRHTDEVLKHAEQLSKDSFGHEIPQVMLLHDDALNADHLDAVLSLFEEHGYRFVSLEEALRDPAYSTPDEYVGPDGLSWLDRWQIALGKAMRPDAPEPPKWAQDAYRRITGQQP